MMQPVARADVTFTQSRLKHGLHCGDASTKVRTREGQFERAVSAAGDAGYHGSVADVVGRAKMGNEVGSEKRVPADVPCGIFQVVIKASSGRDDHHAGYGTLGP